MKTTIDTLQIAFLLMLGLIAVIMIFGTPEDETTWFASFLISKIIGVGCGYIAWLCYKKWNKDNQWLSAYEAYCNKVDDSII